jgi:hypothetical protein
MIPGLIRKIMKTEQSCVRPRKNKTYQALKHDALFVKNLGITYHKPQIHGSGMYVRK